MAEEKKLRDNVPRVKRFNALGTTIFVGLRAADAFLQTYLIRNGWAANFITRLGGQPVLPTTVFTAAGGLQPYYHVISLMAAGSSIKQIATMLYVSEQEMPPREATAISAFNTIINSLNTLFSLWVLTSQAPAPGPLESLLQSPAVMIGIGLYVAGISTEMISELQRTFFKRNPSNKGKPYANGLFSLARHINYGGYTIWRSAYAFTSGGWPWGLAVFSFFFYDFASRGVPVLDQYLSNRVCEPQLSFFLLSPLVLCLLHVWLDTS